MHTATRWRVETSALFDQLCLVGVLTGDPFYARLYDADYQRLAPRLTPVVRHALGTVDRVIKELGGLVPAVLCSSVAESAATTLPEAIAATKAEVIPPDLAELVDATLTVLQFLVDDDIDAYWREHAEPLVTPHLAPLLDYLNRHDVVPTIEAKLGFALPTDEITVYLLHYNQPHGMRLAGSRFISNWGYPRTRTLGIAIHEMMHPPFDLNADSELRCAVDALRVDEFLMDKVHNHNPSFGYNDFEGFVEEDSVQALDQIIDEQMNDAPLDPRKCWRDCDDGMHVLAVALYSQMLEDSFGDRNQTLRDYIVELSAADVLVPGWIEARHRSFYDTDVNTTASGVS
jgi:hypothetical protein